jgi:hypothetical protein
MPSQYNTMTSTYYVALRTLLEAANPLHQRSHPLLNCLISNVTKYFQYDVCSTYSNADTSASGTRTRKTGPETELCSTKRKNIGQYTGTGRSGTGTTASGLESDLCSTKGKNVGRHRDSHKRNWNDSEQPRERVVVDERKER